MERVEAFLRTHLAKHPRDLLPFAAKELGLDEGDVRPVIQRLLDAGEFQSQSAVQVALVKQNGDELISRSQARRLMARCELFRDVTLDFRDVSSVGPAFADEIFRGFAAQHPDLAIHVDNASPEVLRWIEKARAARRGSP